jgi:hypothetical protein
MSELYDKLTNMLAVIPVIMMITLTNVIIAATMAGVVFIQLISVAGWGKTLSLVIAILVAIAVHLYIFCQPKIRNYIQVRSQ